MALIWHTDLGTDSRLMDGAGPCPIRWTPGSGERPAPPVGSGPPPRTVGAAPRSRRLESVLVGVLAAGGAGALAVSFLKDPYLTDHGQTTCPVLLLTGLPCPGCGLTRSWVHLSHGDVGAAFDYNLFGPAFYLVAVGLAIATVVALVRRRPLYSLIDRVPVWLVAGGFGAWILYSVVRIVTLANGITWFDRVIT